MSPPQYNELLDEKLSRALGLAQALAEPPPGATVVGMSGVAAEIVQLLEPMFEPEPVEPP